METTRNIRLHIWRKLRDNADYRRHFFHAQMRDQIASQIELLRGKRGLSKQLDFAAQCDMKQSAISRIERSEYSAWTFKTLTRVADALDAKWTFVLEPAEDVIAQQQAFEVETEREVSQVIGVMEQGSGLLDTPIRAELGFDLAFLRPNIVEEFSDEIVYQTHIAEGSSSWTKSQ